MNIYPSHLNETGQKAVIDAIASAGLAWDADATMSEIEGSAGFMSIQPDGPYYTYDPLNLTITPAMVRFDTTTD